MISHRTRGVYGDENEEPERHGETEKSAEGIVGLISPARVARSRYTLYI